VAAKPAAALGALNPAAVLRRVGDDRRLARELVEVFRGDAPRLLAEIATAVALGDAPRLHRAAHSLKGMLGFFDLTAAASSAAALEAMGRRGDLGSAPAESRALAAELQRVTPLLDSLTQSLEP
jgi:HPt (histidine-containing phosphotransfer) domain-containing protein